MSVAAASPGGPNHPRDLVVIGASAGGVETLKRVVGDLPPSLEASVCIVLHIAPDSPSLLGLILSRAGPLPCRPANDGDQLQAGEILVAPPDHHLVIEDEHVRLTVGPRENGHRPAVDVLFRSAAEAKDGRVIAVVLSGTRGDGTVGLAAVRARGGATIVQDPDEALYPGMPTTALEHVAVDAVVPSGLVAGAIVAMVRGEDPPELSGRAEPQRATAGNPTAGEDEITICPECGGVLSERVEDGVHLWECRVGHRYSPESLVDGQAEDVEAALWAAIRALEDRSRLLERLAVQFEARGHERTVMSFRRRASSAREQALIVRDALARAAQLSLRRLTASDPDEVAEESRQ